MFIYLTLFLHLQECCSFLDHKIAWILIHFHKYSEKKTLLFRHHLHYAVLLFTWKKMKISLRKKKKLTHILPKTERQKIEGKKWWLKLGWSLNCIFMESQVILNSQINLKNEIGIITPWFQTMLQSYCN